MLDVICRHNQQIDYRLGHRPAGSRLLMTATKASSTTETQEFHHPDRLGTQLVTNGGTGSSYRQTTFPFGTTISAETTGNSNQVFTSYDRSAASGLDYAMNRTFSKGQGRFTQVDPIGMSSASLGNPQSNNLYSYVQNMPTDFVDPSGLNMSAPYAIIGCEPDRWDPATATLYAGRCTVLLIGGGIGGNITPRPFDPGGGVGGGGGGGDCDLGKVFGDAGAYFFDNTSGEMDKVLGRRPQLGTQLHSHLYGRDTDAKGSTDIYLPPGYVPIIPTKNLSNKPDGRQSRNRFMGREDDEDGNYLQNYAMFYNSSSNQTLVIWNVDDYRLSNVGGRMRIGSIGFSGASGGALGVGGGHSHFDLFSGRRASLPRQDSRPTLRRSLGQFCP